MGTVKVCRPFDNSLIEELPLLSKEEAFSQLDAAYKLYQDRSKWISLPRRIEILEKAIKILESKKDELAIMAASEGGKPLKDSIVEVNRGLEGIKVAIHEMSNLKGEVIHMGSTSSSLNRNAYTIKEPRGVAFAISAFNHPFNLAIHQVIPAVAMGCPVLIKPARSTPLSCKALLEALYEAGLPKNWAQYCLCDSSVAEEIVSDQRVSFLTFIGSAKVGWHLRSKLSPGATCALEHGGVAPVIIDQSANIDKSIKPLVKGGFYHAGQVCVSVQRIYIHSSLLDTFSEKFINEVKKLKVGDSTKEETDVGPLISPKEVDRIENWVNDAVKKGAKVLIGGKRIGETCFEPTVLLNPPDDCEISTSEVFGPVVLFYSYENVDEAIKRANALPVCFQASVFSQDIDQTFKIVNRLNGLAIMVNDHTAFRVDWMPFGGCKNSGLGVGGIGHTMNDMAIEKLLVFHSHEI